MKTNIFLLIVLLSFHSLEAAPIFSGKFGNPKTCCGRLICLCTHPKGAPCSFKHKALEHPSHVTDLASANQNGQSFFKAAPCHSERAKAASQLYSKDFCLPLNGLLFNFETPECFLHLKNLIFHAIFDRSLDRPPRIFSPL